MSLSIRAALSDLTLEAENGNKYLLSTTLELLEETDPAGNAISITPTGITLPMGPSGSFVLDSSNRITNVIGPNVRSRCVAGHRSYDP
ncbi:MAG TPA: hypothetical protein VMU77_04640 [Acidimicrobiales bacterium]|nr:hypothetical protein [Acidimicrobiales bacterium]